MPVEIDLRRQSGDLTAIDQPARHTEPVLELDVRSELGQIGFVVEQEEVSAAAQPDRLVHLLLKALHRRDAAPSTARCSPGSRTGGGHRPR